MVAGSSIRGLTGQAVGISLSSVVPLLEVNGAGNPPVLPPNPGDIPTASRRGHGWAIAVGVVVGLVCVALIGVGYVSLVGSLRISLGQAIGGAIEGAAAEASSANDTAQAHQIPDGALTLSLLNEQNLDVEWLPGSDSVAISGNKTYVSITVGDDHVVTAANIIGCDYGLTVSSASDPIIWQDHLPGVGTYVGPTGGAESVSACSADSAPTSGWQPADPSVLKQIITPTKG
jgi:hypothetical protein